jgi:hypothetical protein
LVKRARAVGLAITVIGVGQIALALSPGEPNGELLLVLHVLFTVSGVVMAWRPEWADGSTGRLQRDAGRSWFLLCGTGVLIGLGALAIAVGSTIGV